MTTEIEKYKTSDLSIAAFLMMKGMVLSNAYRNPTGQFMFEFDDPTTSGIKYAIEFASSKNKKFIKIYHPYLSVSRK